MSSELPGAFASLRAILKAYQPHLIVTQNTPEAYSLNTKATIDGKQLFFGAALLKKGTVEFHLTPVHANPQLLETATPALLGKRLTKTCFSFDAFASALFSELGQITARSFAWYKDHGFLNPGPMSAETQAKMPTTDDSLDAPKKKSAKPAAKAPAKVEVKPVAKAVKTESKPAAKTAKKTAKKTVKKTLAKSR